MKSVLAGFSIQLLYFFASIVLHVLILDSQAIAGDGKILSGAKQGTYWKIGKDIQRMAASKGINLDLLQSDGSFQNILKLKNASRNATITLSIVQEDILQFLYEQRGNASLHTFHNILQNDVRVVMPLLREEVHILTLRDGKIDSLNDFKGASVAVGPKLSGTYLTAQKVFDAVGVSPKEFVEVGGANAIELLLRNRIDAVFMVTGAPDNRLSAIDKLDRIKLLSLPDKEHKLGSLMYKPAWIESEDYSWLESRIETVDVVALLVVSFPLSQENCDDMKKIVKSIHEETTDLQKSQSYHEKWHEWADLLNSYKKKSFYYDEYCSE